MSIDGMAPRVEVAIAAFNDHDADGLLDAFAEGGTFDDPLVDEPVSGPDLRTYTEEVFQGFPDVRLEVDRAFTREGATAVEGTYAGSHEGTIEGIPPTGNAVLVPTMTVVDVSWAGITRWRDYWDGQAFAEQLGLTFPAVLRQLPRMALAKLAVVG